MTASGRKVKNFSIFPSNHLKDPIQQSQPQTKPFPNPSLATPSLSTSKTRVMSEQATKGQIRRMRSDSQESHTLQIGIEKNTMLLKFLHLATQPFTTLTNTIPSPASPAPPQPLSPSPNPNSHSQPCPPPPPPPPTASVPAPAKAPSPPPAYPPSKHPSL